MCGFCSRGGELMRARDIFILPDLVSHSLFPNEVPGAAFQGLVSFH